MKKTFTIFILFLLLASLDAFSQNYLQAAGLRLGGAGGITYRRVFGANVAAEAMLVGQNNGTAFVFLFEKQKPAVLFDDLNMNFFYGAGAHIGVSNYSNDCYEPYNYNYYYSGYHTMQLGIDGFASFEYLIPRYPIALSLECKPYFEFVDSQSFGIHLFVIAFGARYTF